LFCVFRKGYIEVIEYFIKTNQLTGEPLDEQNRNILFHALPLENTPMIEYLIKSVQFCFFFFVSPDFDSVI